MHVTDLFRPHNDPDDHWDLACSFALARQGAYDLRGVLIDFPTSPRQDPDILAVSQLNYVTGLAVPVVVGSPRLIPENEALSLEAASDLAGIQAFLRLLRDSSQPVVIHVLGSCRDIAMAAQLAPDLFASKCAALYLNAGSGTRDSALARHLEYNVSLDPAAYAAIFRLRCPIYWLPCFEVAPHRDQPNLLDGDYGSFYQFRQDAILPHLAPRLQNYFACMFRHSGAQNPASSAPAPTSDWLQCLQRTPDEGFQRTLGTMMRNMWCTAGFLHAAGRTVLPDGSVVALNDPRAPVFTFDPIRVQCSPDGATTWSEADAPAQRYILHVRDREHYAPAMTQAMRATLSVLR